MRDLICFKHRNYTGEQAPDLRCEACCKIYISALKQRVQNKSANTPDSSSRTRFNWNQRVQKRDEQSKSQEMTLIEPGLI